MAALYVTTEQRHLRLIMQRDSDTADSGKPHIVLYCVKRSMGKSVAVLPQV